jgi:hypothetical protein
LRTIESRVDNWQSISWLCERQYCSRWAKPEVLLNLIQQNNVTENHLSITITAEEYKKLNAEAEDVAFTSSVGQRD